MQKLRFYPDTTLEKLEFQKVIETVKSYAKSAQGKRMIEQVRVSTDFDEIKSWLEETNEFKNLLIAQTYFPLDYLIDLERELKLLKIQDAVLDANQLVAIRKLCLSALSVFKFFDNDEENLLPNLKALAAHTHYDKSMVKLIDSVIDENKEVKDTASKELASIRQSLSKKRNDLDRVFNKLIQKYQKLGLLSDVAQSIRNGRRVVGIVAESKRQIQGIIHDESDTGKTVFLEPGETTELNNSIFNLEREEERELYKILRDLTRSLSEYQPLIADYYLLLSTLDMIQAKAKYALDLGATYPGFKNTTEIKLRKAFHPLLLMHNKVAKKDTIPLDLHLHQGQHILVISGPNAGGKTICLKTVALLQLMLQAGFLIPVDEQSEMGIFNQLFLDIGDAQSIEYELSTYSSHLKTMKYFVEFSDKKTLFLIDELGSGTDPALGGAFAEVILEKLAQEKAYGVVTTHYLNLKVMADKVKGVINGAMAFDEVNLLPLYKLSVGKPGSSHTFSIAQRSGLPKSLIDRAKTLVDIDHIRYDHLLSNIEFLEKEVEKKDNLLHSKEQDVVSFRKEIAELKNQAQRQEEKTKHQIQSSSGPSKFQREAERKLQKLLQEWENRRATQEEEERLAKATQVLFKAIHPVKSSSPLPTLKSEKQPSKMEHFEFIDGIIEEGSKVMIKQFQQKGKVVKISGKKAQVDTGGLIMSVDIEKLGLLE